MTDTSQHRHPTLGIDIGRVLISPWHADGGDTSFIGGSLRDALETPPLRVSSCRCGEARGPENCESALPNR